MILIDFLFSVFRPRLPIELFPSLSFTGKMSGKSCAMSMKGDALGGNEVRNVLKFSNGNFVAEHFLRGAPKLFGGIYSCPTLSRVDETFPFSFLFFN